MKKKRGLLILAGMACLPLPFFVTSAAAQVNQCSPLADQNSLKPGWGGCRGPQPWVTESRGGYHERPK